MNLIDVDVSGVLTCAKELIEQYHQNCLHPRDKRSVDDLFWIIPVYCQTQVDHAQLRLQAGDSSVRGFCVVYADKYEVYTHEGMDEPERRLVAAKELFHVVLDEVVVRSMNLLQHIREMQLIMNLGHKVDSPSAQVEELALIGAMEFLFPYEERLKIIDAANGSGVDYGHVSERFGLPQYYVEQCLTPELMDYFGALKEKGDW